MYEVKLWDVLTLFGGLAVFLFGMMEMNKHLTSIASNRMKTIMVALTKGRARGYITGLGITIVNQSSSATTVLETALVGAGLLTFQQSLAVTLGAELGSTFLPQLIAFPSISKFSSVFIVIGFLMLAYVKSNRGRHIAMTVLTFGFIFLGLDMMAASLRPLRSYEPFIALMRSIEHPILGILLGLVFTMIIQSSGATAGITIAMAMSGTMTVEQAIPINLGAAVGTCITAVLASLTLNWEAKRSAYVHIFFQLLGTIWVFILLMIPYRNERFYIWFIKWFTAHVFGTENAARQIAMAFTFMPIINHSIVFPLLNPIVSIFNKAFPPRKAEKPFGAEHISNSLIKQSTQLSLFMARKEIIRVAGLVMSMLRNIKEAFHSKDPGVIETVADTDSKIDILNKEIVAFLAKLSQGELTVEESETCLNYIYIQNELESIGDVIDKNIMALAAKKINENITFSEDGFHEIEYLIDQLNERFEQLLHMMKNDDVALAKEISKSYKSKEEEVYKQYHIERLQQGLEESIATSSVHLDLISYFSRINRQITYIAKRVKTAGSM